MGQKNQISFFELVRVESPGLESMKLFARTLSISDIFLYSNDPLAEGTPVSLSFSTRFGEVHIKQAQVASQHSPSPIAQDNVVPGMLIRFAQLSPENQQIIRQTFELETTQVSRAPVVDIGPFKEPPTLRVSNPSLQTQSDQHLPDSSEPSQLALEMDDLIDSEAAEIEQMTREVKYEFKPSTPFSAPAISDSNDAHQNAAPASLLPPHDDLGFHPGPPTLPVSQDERHSSANDKLQPTDSGFHPDPPTLPVSQDVRQSIQGKKTPTNEEDLDIPIDVVDVEYEDKETLVVLPNEGRLGKFILIICLVIGGAIAGLFVLLKLIGVGEKDTSQHTTDLEVSHQADLQPSPQQATHEPDQPPAPDTQPDAPETTIATPQPQAHETTQPQHKQEDQAEPETNKVAEYAGPKPKLEPAQPVGQVSLRMIGRPVFRRSGASWKLIFGTDQLTKYNLFTMKNPSRLVVDFMQATLARNAYIAKPKVPFAKKTRTVRRDGFVRFVLDFATDDIPRYKSKQNPKRIEIEFFTDKPNNN